MSTARRVVALFRKASYSPNQHRTNDTAILEETLARLIARGWSTVRVDESALDLDDAAPVPEADLYLNMCQGAIAATALGSLESTGACILNRPSSVLACHRHRLVPAMIAAGIPFPTTEIVDLAMTPFHLLPARPLVRDAADADEPIWIKRGDVHAERNEDVVMARGPEVASAVDAFRARGIGRVSLQRHVIGPVIKFYAIADRSFFRYYEAGAGPSGVLPDVDEARLRDVAFAAAAAVGLSIFGGDVVLASPDEPVLIDLNDWPSFAPFRNAAAERIANYAAHRAEAHRRRSTRSNDATQRAAPSSSLAPDPVSRIQ